MRLLPFSLSLFPGFVFALPPALNSSLIGFKTDLSVLINDYLIPIGFSIIFGLAIFIVVLFIFTVFKKRRSFMVSGALIYKGNSSYAVGDYSRPPTHGMKNEIKGLTGGLAVPGSPHSIRYLNDKFDQAQKLISDSDINRMYADKKVADIREKYHGKKDDHKKDYFLPGDDSKLVDHKTGEVYDRYVVHQQTGEIIDLKEFVDSKRAMRPSKVQDIPLVNDLGPRTAEDFRRDESEIILSRSRDDYIKRHPEYVPHQEVFK